MDNVRDKSVLVTGGASGIGYKCAEILLVNHAKRVAIIDILPLDRNETSTLQREYGKERLLYVVCDVTKAEDFERAFARVVDEFKGLDILINNAGMFNEKLWRRTIDLNLTSVIHGSFMALEHMGKHKGGKGGLIVNISSICGLASLIPTPIYIATKYGVLGFSQTVANCHDKTGVRVVVMCPGITTTALSSRIWERIGDFAIKKDLKKFLDKNPTQTTESVARGVLQLIQNGKNGAVWVCEEDKPPYAVDFPHYSERSLPV